MANDPTGNDELLDHVGPSRRQFVKRLVVGSAFATPVVSSFSMSGVNAVFAQDTNVSGGDVDPGNLDNTDTTDGSTDGTTGNTDGGTGNTDGGTGNTDGGTGNTDGGTGNTDGAVGNVN